VIHTTEVELLGELYTIKSETDPKRVKEIAAFLDSKMREIRSAVPTATLLKVVILAAFYITEELFERKTELSETINTMEEKTANILKMLEDSSLTYSASENRGDPVSLT
jgi:cell division protein ZapA